MLHGFVLLLPLEWLQKKVPKTTSLLHSVLNQWNATIYDEISYPFTYTVTGKRSLKMEGKKYAHKNAVKNVVTGNRFDTPAENITNIPFHNVLLIRQERIYRSTLIINKSQANPSSQYKNMNWQASSVSLTSIRYEYSKKH